LGNFKGGMPIKSYASYFQDSRRATHGDIRPLCEVPADAGGAPPK
jgi:hypothetical protein